jgi:cell fate regulator YaaT (PSP1 superfamily)
MDNDEFIDDDMSSYEDFSYEDISSGSIAVVSGEDLEPITPDTPLYRLRLTYSHETFIAAFKGESLIPRQKVLVPTRYGKDLAVVIGAIKNSGCISGNEVVRIERPASSEDLEKSDKNNEQEKTAFSLCKQKIDEHKLEMKLVSVHYLLEEPKVLFFFTAESRVDFRELVKDLVAVFKTRIELRQIGVRDESRVIGGLGLCGRGFCCHMVSDKLKPVSIKMAKDQNLSLNSMKISGSCGRLLCCLAYEHAFYNEQRRMLPQEGCKINHDGTLWKVIEVNAVMGKLRVSAEDGRQIYLPASSFEKVEGRWRMSSLSNETK